MYITPDVSSVLCVLHVGTCEPGSAIGVFNDEWLVIQGCSAFYCEYSPVNKSVVTVTRALNGVNNMLNPIQVWLMEPHSFEGEIVKQRCPRLSCSDRHTAV